METKKKRIRSPNFPIINLEKSLDLIKMVYSGYDRHPVPLEVLGKAINVSAGSYLAQHVSAFTQYGLVGVEGEKKGKKITVSNLAFRIIVDERPISPERDDLLKKAALSPAMFRKIYDLYPNGLPADDSVIKYELRVDHGFNPNSINDFINVFKSTMEFANAYFSGKMDENDINSIDTEEPEMEAIQRTPGEESISTPREEPHITKASSDFPIKLSEKMMVNLQIQHPLEDEDLRDFLSAIEALKPGILMSVLNKSRTDKDN